MASSVLKMKCEFCGKTAVERLRYPIGDEIWIDLECGHTIIKSALTSEEVTIESKDGRRPFHYQISESGFTADDGQSIRIAFTFSRMPTVMVFVYMSKV
jgi:hypothetical protein